MNQFRWLLKASQLARRRPSNRKVLFYLVVVGASLAIAAIEWLVGWPDWLKPDTLRLKP